MRLPPRPKPLVTPPNTKSWCGTPDAGGKGMNAARTAEGDYQSCSPLYITQAVSMASWVVAALTLMVLHAPTKFLVVSNQIETGNAFRTYALLDVDCMRGHSVIITGASSGFGRAIALKLHALGAVVFAGCNRQSSVDELAAEFAGDTRMLPIKLNVASEDDVAKAVETVSAAGLPLRSLINNAGISAFGWAEVLPVERHAQNVDVNYLGTVRMTRAFLPLLRATKGRLVNMGSIGARMPSAFGSSYLPAKAAMLSLRSCEPAAPGCGRGTGAQP